MIDGNISSETQIARNEEVLFSETSDGMSLMNIDSGNYFHFDQMAARIWKKMDDKIQVGELCARLENEFEIDPETCRNDTEEFLSELGRLGLISLDKP